MERDSSSKVTQQLYQNIWNTLDSVEPATESQKIWYGSMVATLNQLGEERTLRVSGLPARVPTLMWVILLLGAVITIGFASLLDGRDHKAHLIKVLLFALLLTLNGLLIYLLDHPYRGLLKIRPTAYEKILSDRAARAAKTDTTTTIPPARRLP